MTPAAGETTALRLAAPSASLSVHPINTTAMRVLGAAIAVPLVAAVPASTVAAQAPTPTRPESVRRLPPVEVIGSILSAAGPSVAGGQALVDTLRGQQAHAYAPRLLTDVLRQQAGFSTYDDLGSPYKINLSSRGFYASPVVGLPQGLSVFLDGVRQNEPDAAQVNFDLLPMAHVRRIEVLHGNGSLLGRNSLGGAINLVTRRGDGPRTGELEVIGGSYGAFSGEGNVSARTAAGHDYYVGGGYNREDGWRQATDGEQYHGFVNVGTSTAGAGLRLQLMAAKSKALTAGSLPQTIYGVRPDSNLTANDYEDLWNAQAALLGYRQVGAAGRASFNAYVRRHSADRFNANQATDPDAFSQSRNTIGGVTADYRWATSVGGAEFGLRVGADGSISGANVTIFRDDTKFGEGRELTTRVRSPIADVAGFAAADLTVGRATLSVGGRYDYVRVPFRNRLDAARDTTSTFRRFNPRAGLDVDLGGGVVAFGSWARAFRAPSLIELACADPNEPCLLPFALGDDPPIDAVKTETFEGGVRLARGRIVASASAYRTNVRDDIYLFPYTEDEGEPVGSTIDGFFGNLDRTRRAGIESSLAAALPAGISAYANYAYTQATFQVEQEIFSLRTDEARGVENEVEPGDRIPLVPAHTAKAGVSWRAPRTLELGFEGRYIGEQYFRGDEANEDRPLNDYLVGDARIAVTVGRWNVSAIATNVFNNAYAVFGTYNINQGNPRGPTLERFITPGYARQVRFVMRHAFGAARVD